MSHRQESIDPPFSFHSFFLASLIHQIHSFVDSFIFYLFLAICTTVNCTNGGNCTKPNHCNCTSGWTDANCTTSKWISKIFYDIILIIYVSSIQIGGQYQNSIVEIFENLYIFQCRVNRKALYFVTKWFSSRIILMGLLWIWREIFAPKRARSPSIFDAMYFNFRCK